MNSSTANAIHDMFPNVDIFVIQELLKELPSKEQVIDRLISGDYQDFKSKSKTQQRRGGSFEMRDSSNDQKYGYNKRYKQKVPNYQKPDSEKYRGYKQRKPRFEQNSYENYTDKGEKITGPVQQPESEPAPVEQKPVEQEPPVIVKNEPVQKVEKKFEPYYAPPEPVPEPKEESKTEEEQPIKQSYFNPRYINQKLPRTQSQPQPQIPIQPQQQIPVQIPPQQQIPVQIPPQQQIPVYNMHNINQQQLRAMAPPVLMLPQDIAAVQPNLYMFGHFVPPQQLFGMPQQSVYIQPAAQGYKQTTPPGF